MSFLKPPEKVHVIELLLNSLRPTDAYMRLTKLTIIGSDNGLSYGRRQAIIWTSGWMLLIGSLGININGIWREIHAFSLKNMHLKNPSAKWRPFCLGLSVLMTKNDPFIPHKQKHGCRWPKPVYCGDPMFQTNTADLMFYHTLSQRLVSPTG